MRLHSKGITGAGVLGVLLFTGCDVVNPGPVQDEFLAQAASQQGLVNGSIRRLSESLSYGSYTMALLSREIFPGGQIGAFGHDVIVQGGHVIPGSDVGRWNDTQQARFIAETAIKRFTDVNAPDNMMYQAHLWAGYAYRTLGEWWCNAVIGSTDPASTVPGSYEAGVTTYFQRAEANFTAAMGFAATAAETQAAQAGRAAARLWLGNYAGAQTDAAAVPNTFVFNIKYDAQEQAYYNSVFWANARTPYSSYTMHFTWFKDYYTNTGDPRTPWVDDPAFPLSTGALSGYGPVPWSNQRKFRDRGDDARIASGWEMRLVEAEAILAQNAANYAQAMTLINQVRTRNVSATTASPLAAWSAANSTEAWTFLKRERAIELWLEGRRLGDERRWAANGTPGALDTPDWSALTPLFAANPRSYCLDIPNSERDSNPNVPPAITP